MTDETGWRWEIHPDDKSVEPFISEFYGSLDSCLERLFLELKGSPAGSIVDDRYFGSKYLGTDWSRSELLGYTVIVCGPLSLIHPIYKFYGVASVHTNVLHEVGSTRRYRSVQDLNAEDFGLGLGPNEKIRKRRTRKNISHPDMIEEDHMQGLDIVLLEK